MNGQNTNGLDDRILELEREKEELRVRYENELEAEKVSRFYIPLLPCFWFDIFLFGYY